LFKPFSVSVIIRAAVEVSPATILDLLSGPDGMGSLPQLSGSLHVKRVAIIGAGPSGLAVAKYLLAEDTFEKIDVYEQQYGIPSSLVLIGVVDAWLFCTS
jgi:hypothetical protein